MPPRRDFGSVMDLLREYRSVHGDGNVPVGYVCADGYRLGAWVSRQRSLYRRGALPADRAQALRALGVVLPDSTAEEPEFARAVARLRAFRRDAGHANPRQRQCSPDGFALGEWLTKMRVQERAGRLDPQRRAVLEAEGVIFDPAVVRAAGYRSEQRAGAARARRQRTEASMLAAARDLAGAGRPLSGVHRDYRTEAGLRLGAWLAEARRSRAAGTLDPRVAAELDGLGMDWDMGAGRRAGRAVRSRSLQRICAGVAAFAAVHGHTRVPVTYRDESGYHLGRALAALRRKAARGTLDAEAVAALASVDVLLPGRPAGPGSAEMLDSMDARGVRLSHQPAPTGKGHPDGKQEGLQGPHKDG